MTLRLNLAAAIGLLLAAGSALAAEFTVLQTDRSTIAFTVRQMGVPVDGRFRRFSGDLSFDPARPATARTAIEIELASIDAGSQEADDEVVGKQWFDAKNYPKARFVSTSVRTLGGNHYEVAGQLTLKGRTRDLTAV